MGTMTLHKNFYFFFYFFFFRLRAQFQLFTYDYNIVIENTKLWKTTAMYKHPLHIEVLLHLPSMKDNESFVAKSGGDKLLISGDYFQTRRTIVLEEWKLSLNPHASTRDDYKGAYLRSSIFIRALEAYCHLLPAYSLLKRIRLAAQNPQSHLHKFVVGFRVSKDLTLQPTECGLDSPLNGWENDTVATVQFPGTLETMLGYFCFVCVGVCSAECLNLLFWCLEHFICRSGTARTATMTSSSTACPHQSRTLRPAIRMAHSIVIFHLQKKNFYFILFYSFSFQKLVRAGDVDIGRATAQIPRTETIIYVLFFF